METHSHTSASSALIERYDAVRRTTLALGGPLSAEDAQVQSMPDASPTKWHLAHTTWFFERFVLVNSEGDYESPHPAFNFLFNSYYKTVGEHLDRPRRGLMTRPSLDEVRSYRTEVDRAIARMIDGADADLLERIEPLITTGLHHELQHQELLLTDAKHLLSLNPLEPSYRSSPRDSRSSSSGADPAVGPSRWISFEGGMLEIGHDGVGFAYDNESPRHERWIRPFRLASRLVTCGEFLHFMEDGGYERPDLWLSIGWDVSRREGWTAPMYWSRAEEGWRVYTLRGTRAVDPDEPVCHVSFFEADAFARWAGSRLPNEDEWEVAARACGARPNLDAGRTNLLDTERLHPTASTARGASSGDDPQPRDLCQLFGDVWEWTASPYLPYPGYHPPPGALGEYNGKFMCNQYVLRGGSCVTPATHIRPSYRNFFPPEARWQFSGFRLAR